MWMTLSTGVSNAVTSYIFKFSVNLENAQFIPLKDIVNHKAASNLYMKWNVYTNLETFRRILTLLQWE